MITVIPMIVTGTASHHLLPRIAATTPNTLEIIAKAPLNGEGKNDPMNKMTLRMPVHAQIVMPAMLSGSRAACKAKPFYCRESSSPTISAIDQT